VTAAWLRVGNDFVTIEVVVRPSSPRREVLRTDARGIVIAIASPPERGKANDELIRLIAKLAQVPRSAVAILSGETSRRKVVKITTNEPTALAAKLGNSLS